MRRDVGVESQNTVLGTDGHRLETTEEVDDVLTRPLGGGADAVTDLIERVLLEQIVGSLFETVDDGGRQTASPPVEPSQDAEQAATETAAPR